MAGLKWSHRSALKPALPRLWSWSSDVDRVCYGIYERQRGTLPLLIGLQRRRPIGESRISRLGQLPQSAGALIEDPDIALVTDRAEAARDRQMTAVGSPRRILVLALERQLLHHPIFHADCPHLEIAVLL